METLIGAILAGIAAAIGYYLNQKRKCKPEGQTIVEDCYVTQPEKGISSTETVELKEVRTFNICVGKASQLAEMFDNRQIQVIPTLVGLDRKTNITTKGRDLTKLTSEDYALIKDIMDDYYSGKLLLVSSYCYFTEYPETGVDCNETPYVAVTNVKTLNFALNNALSLKKSMDSYYRAYNKVRK
jgi:hypothetical protein